MKEWNSKFDDAVNGLSTRLRPILHGLPDAIKEQAYEIRLRRERPLSITCAGGTVFLTSSYQPTYLVRDNLLVVNKAELEESFQTLCSYSIHSHQNEIKNGYVTMRGGHRAGICGTAVVSGGEVVSVRDVSSINLRVAREVSGAADEFFTQTDWNQNGGFLIAGAPSSGKTTLLRDIARQLSWGRMEAPMRVAVIDERGELAGTFQGESGNDLGPCCDILDGYPKGIGILQAVRTLSPQVIICDEVGDEADLESMKAGMNAGVRMIASIHAGSLRELLQRRQARELLATGAFFSVVLLEGQAHVGKIAEIYRAGEENGKMDWTDMYCTGRSDSGLLPIKKAI